MPIPPALTSFVLARRAFLLKASLSFGLLLAGASYAADRFTVGADPQANRCLADYRTFVVDHRQHDIERGQLVAFRADGLAPIFDDGTLIAKYVRGVPGDTVEITADHDVLINGEVIETGLRYADTLGQTPDDFVGRMVIPDGQLWVMGDTEYSFDSRYWGTIRQVQISGRAHGLF